VPLSNFDIVTKCKELSIKNFKGVFMRDELKNRKGSKNECMIINIDHSSNEGTHWTCLFIKNYIPYYFDSYGFPPTEEVKSYCQNPGGYNSFEIQKANEVICGHYCIFVLWRLSNGYDFKDVIDELYEYNNSKSLRKA